VTFLHLLQLSTEGILLNQTYIDMSNKVYWKMRNGNVISVDDMTEEHAKNTLKLVLRNRETVVKQILKSKRREFTLHGDMANEFNSSQQENDEYDESLLMQEL
jgi:hypothetical protein